ncbi:hypothetical protein [Herbiconiux liukaitaii]|uniref:hypothetical protein n=1 Tax=Herbiconiux liukaitaii TaxID=3342799 RepID=UPI0035BAB924
MLNTAQQIGGSVGIAVFSSAATAISGYITEHAVAAGEPATLINATLAEDHVVFWIASAIFVGIAALTAVMFQSGSFPVDPDAEPAMVH